VTKFNTIKC